MTIRFLVTSLTKALLPRLLSLAGRPALGKVLVVANFFHLRMMEATVFMGPSMFQKCFGTLPHICTSTQSCLGALRTIHRPHGLVFAMTCTVNCGTFYSQVCVSFQIMSNQMNLPQVDSNQVVETARIINGSRMHMSLILSLIAKGLNT